MRRRLRHVLLAGGSLLLCPLPLVAQARHDGEASFGFACPGLDSRPGRCAALLAESQGELIHYPGLVASHIEACFDAGYETWFSGVTDSGVGYSGSFAGESFILSWRGGPVLQGTCAELAIWGQGFVIRPGGN